MDLALSAARLVHQGASTQLWGLACPFYCSAPGVRGLLAALLLGFILGVAFGAWLIYTYVRPGRGLSGDLGGEPAAPAEVLLARRRARLGSYVYDFFGNRGALLEA